jgi:ATP-binding cassette, subfamily C (CFTR/MRP), member 1
MAFTTLSLFNILRFPLVVLPKALRALSEGLAAMARLETFLMFEEADVEDIRKKNPLPTAGVSIRNAKFHHPGKENFVLEVPEFSVAPGERVAIVGRVGAGKSSLLSAILGDMHVSLFALVECTLQAREMQLYFTVACDDCHSQMVSGDIRVGGTISYVPQNPWCQNLTLRENILFGQEMDEELYDRVIHDCALELDMQILPKG